MILPLAPGKKIPGPKPLTDAVTVALTPAGNAAAKLAAKPAPLPSSAIAFIAGEAAAPSSKASKEPSWNLISQLLQLSGGQPLLPPYPQGIKEKVEGI